MKTSQTIITWNRIEDWLKPSRRLTSANECLTKLLILTVCVRRGASELRRVEPTAAADGVFRRAAVHVVVGVGRLTAKLSGRRCRSRRLISAVPLRPLRRSGRGRGRQRRLPAGLTGRFTPSTANPHRSDR